MPVKASCFIEGGEAGHPLYAETLSLALQYSVLEARFRKIMRSDC